MGRVSLAHEQQALVVLGEQFGLVVRFQNLLFLAQQMCNLGYPGLVLSIGRPSTRTIFLSSA